MEQLANAIAQVVIEGVTAYTEMEYIEVVSFLHDKYYPNGDRVKWLKRLSRSYGIDVNEISSLSSSLEEKAEIWIELCGFSPSYLAISD